jgi:hypothetical protein
MLALSWKSVVLVGALAFATACSPQSHGKHPTSERGGNRHERLRKGVADVEEWLAIDGFGAQIRVPRGWEFGHQGVLVIGTEKDGKAAFILVGAANVGEAKKKYETALDLLKMDVGASDLAQRAVVIHDLSFQRQDYEKASIEGKPAHGVALVGDAPGDAGLLLFVGYSLTGTEPIFEKAFHEAIDSLSRE